MTCPVSSCEIPFPTETRYGGGRDEHPEPARVPDHPGDLVAELRARAPKIGTNDGLWPGLAIYRYDAPAAPQWEEVRELHLCVIAQGCKIVTTDGAKCYYDPLTYLAISDNLPFRTEIVEASPAKPFLSFGLQLDHELVREVSSDIILERQTTAFTSTRATREEASGPAPSAATPSFVSALDRDMMDAILRFLRALSTGADRRVLAPVYLKEIVYRALQAEQYTRLTQRAASESASNPVSGVIAYVQEHIGEPLSVSELAERAFMSPSAFSHLFRDVTGRSPYQFVKEMRLNKARELLPGVRVAAGVRGKVRARCRAASARVRHGGATYRGAAAEGRWFSSMPRMRILR